MPKLELDEQDKVRFGEAVAKYYVGAECDEETLRETIWILAEHRVAEFRNNVMPWLTGFCPLDQNSRVLEIGAGTGSSVAVLADTGARVDGIDIMEQHLKLAELRLELLGHDRTRILHRNATDLDDLYAEAPYDLIVYSAVLEHMTYAERLKSLRDSWDNLRPGGVMFIYETPNRLWFHDGHTSAMNFFHWLPDELALEYARFSPRAAFADSHRIGMDQEALARWGRGASFHEFELAIGLKNMEVTKSLHTHLRELHPHYKDAYETELGRRFHGLMRELEPDRPAAFFDEVLHFGAIKRGEAS